MKRSVCAVTLLVAGLAACGGGKPPETAAPPPAPIGKIERLDPALDAIVPAAAKIEKLAGDHKFTEGPIWTKDGLLFSDIPNNKIFRWMPVEGKVVEFLAHSGYDKDDYEPGRFVGSNGLTLDKDGNLIICEHANGRVSRLEKDGKRTVLAAKYQGKRLNSPNDAVFKSNGDLYFTDPPYGFAKQDDDPAKELKFNGIYRLAKGKLTLLNKEQTRPNGIAFSPDEKWLYVANSDANKKVWYKYEVKADGTLGASTIFFDVTAETAEGLPDGMKVDKAGNLYCTGPGGVWIFSPEGKNLGKIAPPETPANVGWGDADGKTLFMTARTGLYRIKLSAEGIRPQP